MCRWAGGARQSPLSQPKQIRAAAYGQQALCLPRKKLLESFRGLVPGAGLLLVVQSVLRVRDATGPGTAQETEVQGWKLVRAVSGLGSPQQDAGNPGTEGLAPAQPLPARPAPQALVSGPIVSPSGVSGPRPPVFLSSAGTKPRGGKSGRSVP